MNFWQGLKEVLSTPAILVASGAEATMYLGFGAFLGFLPVYAKAAHLNDGQIALVVGTQLLTALVAKPAAGWLSDRIGRKPVITVGLVVSRSEEHTSELQSLMRISYAVFFLKKKKTGS